MMGGSWMGSHITNDDLVKETRIAENYTFRLLKDEKSLMEIEGTPQPAAAVVWGKIVYTVAMPDLVPVEIAYFDDEGNKVRTIRYSEVKEIDGRKIPLTMEVLPLEKPNESTIIHYDSITFDVSIKDDFFSIQTLKK